MKTILDIQSALIHKKTSILETVSSYLKKIEKENPKLNAFLTITGESALKLAAKQDKELAKNPDIFAQKPLFGVPTAYKDLFLTKGIRTTAGSKVLENYLPQYSATVVEKLEGSGAISLGKLNCDAWAHGASGENSQFGPTRNPEAPDYVPGGSSSGTACAVAAGLVPFAIGTDTGGSIRQPANFCGVVGTKPTYGRVSRYGVIAMASSLDSMGHITNNVSDAAKVLEITAGHDPYDSTSAGLPVPKYSANLEKKLGKIKVGIAKEYLDGLTHPDVTSSFEKAKSVLLSMGVELVEISLPHTKYGIPVYYVIQPAEVSSNLSRYDGIRYGKNRSHFGDEAKRRIIIGTYTLSAGYYDAYYVKAMKIRTLIKQDFTDCFKTVDAILSPVSPFPAFKIGEKVGDPLAMYLADVYTATINLAGLPAIALPNGKNSEGLPLGIQLISGQFTEERLFPVAYQFEKILHGQ